MMYPLYIDPGTGSMLFSVLVGLLATLYFVGKAAIIKLKFIFSGKKAKEAVMALMTRGKRHELDNGFWS